MQRFNLHGLRFLRVPRRGVSAFAMLTGTLPFTVEPFNIKQLHQKMVSGEIGSIPSDVSKGHRNIFTPVSFAPTL